jgi:IclR family transcriptional regulator, acetate operon repressor
MGSRADSPALRLFALLEHIVAKNEFVSLQGLVEETGLPKPTVHRMLQQLESGEILIRQADGRHFGTGARVRRFAETVLLNATQHGARRTVLRHLAQQTGETCTVATLSGAEVLVLDRIETPHPLRFHLPPGTRIPAHCSASGKAILAQLGAAQRSRLLEHAPLEPLTERSVVDVADLEAELATAAERGYASAHGEHLPGLVALAVTVPTSGRSNMSVEVELPSIRLGDRDPEELLAPLRDAAHALGRVEADGAARV